MIWKVLVWSKAVRHLTCQKSFLDRSIAFDCFRFISLSACANIAMAKQTKVHKSASQSGHRQFRMRSSWAAARFLTVAGFFRGAFCLEFGVAVVALPAAFRLSLGFCLGNCLWFCVAGWILVLCVALCASLGCVLRRCSMWKYPSFSRSFVCLQHYIVADH